MSATQTPTYQALEPQLPVGLTGHIEPLKVVYPYLHTDEHGRYATYSAGKLFLDYGITINLTKDHKAFEKALLEQVGQAKGQLTKVYFTDAQVTGIAWTPAAAPKATRGGSAMPRFGR